MSERTSRDCILGTRIPAICPNWHDFCSITTPFDACLVCSKLYFLGIQHRQSTACIVFQFNVELYRCAQMCALLYLSTHDSSALSCKCNSLLHHSSVCGILKNKQKGVQDNTIDPRKVPSWLHIFMREFSGTTCEGTNRLRKNTNSSLVSWWTEGVGSGSPSCRWFGPARRKSRFWITSRSLRPLMFNAFDVSWIKFRLRFTFEINAPYKFWWKFNAAKNKHFHILIIAAIWLSLS